MRIALFTNNYLPFCGGVTISVETLRQGLEAAGHEAWVFGPRLAGAQDPSARIVRYPSIPATTYPEFALAVPYSRRIGRLVTGLNFDVIHAQGAVLPSPDIITAHISNARWLEGRRHLEGGQVSWRERLFAAMHLNANLPAAYFGVPTGQVVEMGLEVEI